MSDVEAYNETIMRANAEMDALAAAGIEHKARRMAQGVEIEIIRPGFGGTASRSFRIIPWVKGD